LRSGSEAATVCPSASSSSVPPEIGGGLPKLAALLASAEDPVAGTDASAATVADGAVGTVGEVASVAGPTPRPASDDGSPLDTGVEGSTATSTGAVPELDLAPEAATPAVPLDAPVSTTECPCNWSLQPQPPMVVPTEPRIATTTLVRM
jgi:hypothetical protein